MELDILTAVSPIDGRYRGKTETLADYFSEYALMKYRVFVEIEYYIALCELPIPQLAGVDKALFPRLREIYSASTAELTVNAVTISVLGPKKITDAMRAGISEIITSSIILVVVCVERR